MLKIGGSRLKAVTAMVKNVLIVGLSLVVERRDSLKSVSLLTHMSTRGSPRILKTPRPLASLPSKPSRREGAGPIALRVARWDPWAALSGAGGAPTRYL
jgi:hypothetical protein